MTIRNALLHVASFAGAWMAAHYWLFGYETFGVSDAAAMAVGAISTFAMARYVERRKERAAA